MNMGLMKPFGVLYSPICEFVQTLIFRDNDFDWSFSRADLSKSMVFQDFFSTDVFSRNMTSDSFLGRKIQLTWQTYYSVI